MRRALAFALIILATMSGARAADGPNVTRLLNTNSCNGCNLRGANLRGAHLSGAGLKRDRLLQVDGQANAVAWHGERLAAEDRDLARDVRCAEEELGRVAVHKWGVAAAFVLVQHVHF